MNNSTTDFFKELDKFKFHLPGNQIVPFTDNQSLLKMVQAQYPGWKNVGNVTSVPIARVPRLFLKQNQMSLKLQNDFKYLQKGEEGETKIYRLFINNKDNTQNGMMVLPNVDSSELFDTPSAKVEINLILLHPFKGVFVFNIKSQGGKGLTPLKIQEDFTRHCNFIKSLMLYGDQNSTDFVPIHSVYCHLSDDNKAKFEPNLTTAQVGGSVQLLSKADLKPDSFDLAWQTKLNGIENFDRNLNDKFDVLVARLVALNSLESSIALIHDKLSKNYIQAVNKNKKQFDEFVADQATKTTLEELSLTKIESKRRKGEREKERYIIWTAEQLSIIAKVAEHLQNPSLGGLRLVVRGCKGSGKTMLLVFLAKLADKLGEQSPVQTSNKVVVCNGEFFNGSELNKQLEHLLLSTGVSVLKKR